VTSQDDNERDETRRRSGASVGIAVVALGLGLAALVASVVQGPPRELPSYALGWPLFLYVERALFAALITIVACVVGLRMLCAATSSTRSERPARRSTSPRRHANRSWR
jgi:hypothetical protein